MKQFVLTLGIWMLSLAFAQGQRGFAIVVDPQSYKEAEEEIRQYADAIEDVNGLHVFVVIDKWGVPDSIRQELMRLHALDKHAIEGAVLVGDIPVAMIRDAQHLTSAFKMDQRHDRKESSVPSDRYYDDFGLRFDYLGKDEDMPYFYYSLAPESEQRLEPDIYTGRIRPTDCNGTSRYEKLRAYLVKVVKEKRNAETLDQILFFGGHGYISESMVARMDEKQGLYEHFPWLRQQKNGISFIDHTQEDFIKSRLMNELMRPELDFALLHHHGYWDTQYLSNIPAPKNAFQAKEFIQNYVRSRIRSAVEDGEAVDSVMSRWEQRFDVPRSWWENVFAPETCRKDSLEADELDLHLTDFLTYGYAPDCRVVMIDACFCGSFHREDCIANEYIFSPGRTVVCIANTVNVLQDKWSDHYIGLLGLGMNVGEVARYSGYLESHTIGDPTFTFSPVVPVADINRLLAEGKVSDWKKQLKNSSFPDLQCMAIEQLVRRGELSSVELLDLFRQSSSSLVRVEALVALSGFGDDQFVEALQLAVRDSYELVQRFGLRFVGQSGDERLIPALISVCISNNTSERCNFNAMNALSFYPDKPLLAEFAKQFNDPSVRYIGKEDVGRAIEKAIRSSAAKWVESTRSVMAPDTGDKKRRSAIRTLRNYCPHDLIPDLLAYLETCGQPEVQVMLLEALGWQKYSCMADRIAVVAKAMSEKESLAEEVRREALKTYNRLKRLK